MLNVFLENNCIQIQLTIQNQMLFLQTHFVLVLVLVMAGLVEVVNKEGVTYVHPLPMRIFYFFYFEDLVYGWGS